MRSANNVGNAGPHVRQTFLNDVFTFLTEVTDSVRESERKEKRGGEKRGKGARWEK
jgi:hypothetical protein